MGLKGNPKASRGDDKVLSAPPASLPTCTSGFLESGSVCLGSDSSKGHLKEMASVSGEQVMVQVPTARKG